MSEPGPERPENPGYEEAMRYLRENPPRLVFVRLAPYWYERAWRWLVLAFTFKKVFRADWHCRECGYRHCAQWACPPGSKTVLHGMGCPECGIGRFWIVRDGFVGFRFLGIGPKNFETKESGKTKTSP